MVANQVVWYGPRTLTKVRQVCIPVELLRALDLGVGSELQFALDGEKNEIRIRPAGRTIPVQDEGDDS